VGLGLFSVDPCGSKAAEEDSWIAGRLGDLELKKKKNTGLVGGL
jgi:hypothetical protein